MAGAATEARPPAEAVFRLLDRAGLLLFTVSTDDFRFTYLNDACVRSLGFGPDDLATVTLWDVIAPEQREAAHRRLTTPGRGDDSFEFATDFVARDGRRVRVDGSALLQREGTRVVSAHAMFRDVTAQKRVEDELRTSEQTYRTLARNLPHGAVLMFDRDLRFLVADGEQLLGSIGLSRADIEGRLALDVVLPSNRAVVERMYRATLAGATGVGEYSRSGRTFALHTVPVRGIDGTVVAGLSLSYDITDRKAAELEVLRSRAQLRAVIESSIDGFWSVDREYRLQVYNDSFRRSYEGRNGRDVVPGMSLYDPSLPPEHVDPWRARYDRALAGERFQVDVRTMIDGRERLLLLAFSPIVENDQITGVAVSSRDMTERAEAQIALHESEARLRATVQHALDAVITIDADGAIEAFNPAAEKTFGRVADELRGQPISQLLPDDVTPAPGTPIALGRRETMARRGDGTDVAIELAASEVPLEGRRLYTLLVRDITERKEVDRLKSEFVSVVSHELRTPLTSIRGSLGLLEGGVVGELPAPARELVSIARANSDRLIRLINDILDLEKLEAGKIELRNVRMDARELVDTTLEGLGGLAESAKVTLVSHLAMLPVLFGDRDRLIQVLTNLVSNAIKYSTAGDQVHVHATRESSGRVRIAVRDHGPGIAPEDRARLFGRFEQLEASDRRERGGTGLGLAISKAIVEQHGGAIGVESRVGEGSTFWFELSPAPTLPPGSARDDRPPPEILLVEDDDELAEVLAPLLADAGYRLTRAASIAEAETALSHSTPALVLMDVGLPDGSGLDLVERIHQRPATEQTPVVVMSGREVVRGTFANPRVLEWVTKPFDDRRLLRAVRNAVRRVGAPRALVVDDDAATRSVLIAQLKGLGIEPIEAVDGAQALAIARTTPLDLIVLDVAMPAPDGFAVVDQLRHEGLAPSLLVYSGIDLSAAERQSLTLGVTRHLTKSRTSERDFLVAVRALLDGLLNEGP